MSQYNLGIHDEQSKANKKNYGFHEGIVVSLLTRGQCKIWIPSIYPKEWAEVGDDVTQPKGYMLPSAEQAGPLFGLGVYENGLYDYPEVGSHVWCFFRDGNINYPVYFASAINRALTVKTKGFEEVYKPDIDPSVNGPSKHLIRYNNIDISLYHNGMIELMTKEPIEGREDKVCNYSKITLDKDGKIVLESTEGIEIKTNNFKINSIVLDTTAFKTKIRGCDEKGTFEGFQGEVEIEADKFHVNAYGKLGDDILFDKEDK